MGKKKIFLSYKIKEGRKYRISELVEFLENKSEIEKVVYCERDNVSDIDKFMINEIKNADIFLAFITSESLWNSPDCKKERNMAYQNNKKIIPILGIDINFEDLPPEFSRKKGIKFIKKWKTPAGRKIIDDHHFKKILKELYKLIKENLKQKSLKKEEILDQNLSEYSLLDKEFLTVLRNIDIFKVKDILEFDEESFFKEIYRCSSEIRNTLDFYCVKNKEKPLFKISDYFAKNWDNFCLEAYYLNENYEIRMNILKPILERAFEVYNQKKLENQLIAIRQSIKFFEENIAIDYQEWINEISYGDLPFESLRDHYLDIELISNLMDEYDCFEDVMFDYFKDPLDLDDISEYPENFFDFFYSIYEEIDEMKSKWLRILSYFVNSPDELPHFSELFSLDIDEFSEDQAKLLSDKMVLINWFEKKPILDDFTRLRTLCSFLILYFNDLIDKS